MMMHMSLLIELIHNIRCMQNSNITLNANILILIFCAFSNLDMIS